MSTSDLSTAIILHNAGQLSASAHADAVATHDRLLVLARKGTTIATPEAAAKCADFIRDLSAFLTYVETGRTSAKEPILNEGRAIDALARSLTADIEVERKRINGLLGAYQEGERMKEREAREKAAEDERKARLAEQDRLRKIEEDAQRVQREADEKARQEQAERDRVAREQQAALDAKAATARTARGREKAAADAEAARLNKEQEDAAALVKKQQEDAARAQAATAAAAVVVDDTTAAILATRTAPAAPKLAGVAVRQEIYFEVLDIVALYESTPAAVKMEPNKAVLKSLLARLPDGQTLPGVKWYRQAAASVRG